MGPEEWGLVRHNWCPSKRRCEHPRGAWAQGEGMKGQTEEGGLRKNLTCCNFCLGLPASRTVKNQACLNLLTYLLTYLYYYVLKNLFIFNGKADPQREVEAERRITAQVSATTWVDMKARTKSLLQVTHMDAGSQGSRPSSTPFPDQKREIGSGAAKTRTGAHMRSWYTQGRDLATRPPC